jgi:hypothetical protein
MTTVAAATAVEARGISHRLSTERSNAATAIKAASDKSAMDGTCVG